MENKGKVETYYYHSKKGRTFKEEVRRCQQSQLRSWVFHSDFLQLQPCKPHPCQTVPFQIQHVCHPTYKHTFIH